MMGLSVLYGAIMFGMFVYMIFKAKFAQTRRMAFIPLGCAVMELLSAGLLTTNYFMLSLLLIVLRAVILLCCAGALRQDTAIAARRVRRRLAAKHNRDEHSDVSGNFNYTSSSLGRCA